MLVTKAESSPLDHRHRDSGTSDVTDGSKLRHPPLSYALLRAGPAFEQAKKRLEKFKEQVNCAKRLYSMLPGWGRLGEYLGVPNTYDPRAMTSDTVSADAKRLLGGSGLPFATNGIPYYLPGTERSYLSPPTPSARSDAPWDRFPHMR